MGIALRGVLLGLLLGSAALPGDGILAGDGPQPESEALAARGSQAKEEEGIVGGASDYDEPRPQVYAASDDPEDGSERAKPRPHFARGEKRLLSVWSGSSLQPRPYGTAEEPVCTVKLDRRGVWGPNHLEVVGLFPGYVSGFLKSLSRSTWGEGDLEIFGLCPTDAPHGTVSTLQHLSGYLAKPEKNRFLLLHLEEVKWEAETKLRFKLTFQEDAEQPLGPLQLAVMVFYQGEKEWMASEEKFLVGGEGLYRQQMVCLSNRTQYLALQGSVRFDRHTPGQLIYDASLEIRHHSNTDLLSLREAQELLFGFDSKRFARMTPVVLLSAKRASEGATFLPSSSFLAANGLLDTVPYPKPSFSPASGAAEALSFEGTGSWTDVLAPAPMSTGQFLEALSQFVNKVLSPSGEASPTSRPHLQLDVDILDTLPHGLLNLSETVALEQLVQSEDHLVLLFPKGSQALMEERLNRWVLDETLLQKVLEKLRSVIRELAAVPSFRANAGLFRSLLAWCYYPSGNDSTAADKPEGAGSRSKIHSLLLLKALQAVRARWRESRKVSRANRSARGGGDYCRLQELRIDLVSTGYVVLPEWYNANNCVGPCRFPLSDRIPDYYSHTIFLLRTHERGVPLQRAPCCVPVKYSQSLIITHTNDEGIKAKNYPNMVAEACGCR